MTCPPNEITKFNYQKALEEVVELIRGSDFVAIDCTVETTGLLLQDETFNRACLDDIDQWFGTWYDTIKSKEKSVCLMEVGVAIFKALPDNPKVLEVEVFNIPVIPACIDDNEIARFRGQTSTRLTIDGYGQDFIENTDFDVNKVFYLGAPYLNRQMQDRADNYMQRNPNFMVARRKRRLNPYLMPKLCEQVSEEERQVIIQRLKGVSRVFETVIESGVPVIGHHLLLKLMFVYKDFIEYLPDTYPECVDKLREVFKVVYDTKQIAKELKFNLKDLPESLAGQLKESDLKLYDLVRILNKPCNRIKAENDVSLNLGDRSENYLEDLKDLCEGDILEEDSDSFSYVAGFDALTCGHLFLSLIKILDTAKLDCLGDIGASPPPEIDANYLKMFLEGKAFRFRSKMFEAPVIPDRKGPEFLEVMKVKRYYLNKLIEEKEKKKMEQDIAKKNDLIKNLKASVKSFKQSAEESTNEVSQPNEPMDKISQPALLLDTLNLSVK